MDTKTQEFLALAAELLGPEPKLESPGSTVDAAFADRVAGYNIAKVTFLPLMERVEETVSRGETLSLEMKRALEGAFIVHTHNTYSDFGAETLNVISECAERFKTHYEHLIL